MNQQLFWKKKKVIKKQQANSWTSCIQYIQDINGLKIDTLYFLVVQKLSGVRQNGHRFLKISEERDQSPLNMSLTVYCYTYSVLDKINVTNDIHLHQTFSQGIWRACY